MTAETAVVMDVEQRAALPFPRSLPEFQQLFPDDPACASYLEKARWESGFVCPRCEASQAARERRPTTNFTPEIGPTPHLMGVWLNRIGMLCLTRGVSEDSPERD